jgi:hypothetical protein
VIPAVRHTVAVAIAVVAVRDAVPVFVPAAMAVLVAVGDAVAVAVAVVRTVAIPALVLAVAIPVPLVLAFIARRGVRRPGGGLQIPAAVALVPGRGAVDEARALGDPVAGCPRVAITIEGRGAAAPRAIKAARARCFMSVSKIRTADGTNIARARRGFSS